MVLTDVFITRNKSFWSDALTHGYVCVMKTAEHEINSIIMTGYCSSDTIIKIGNKGVFSHIK